LISQRDGRLRRLCVIPLAIIDAGQLYLTIAEVIALADAEALALKAFLIQPAVGHAQRYLVGIADAVAAGEAVVAPQRIVVETGFAGIEDGQVSLVLFGYVEVEQPRF